LGASDGGSGSRNDIVGLLEDSGIGKSVGNGLND
jgi:hypothetical protein